MAVSASTQVGRHAATDVQVLRCKHRWLDRAASHQAQRSPATGHRKLWCLPEGAWRCSARRAPDKEHLGRPKEQSLLEIHGITSEALRSRNLFKEPAVELREPLPGPPPDCPQTADSWARRSREEAAAFREAATCALPWLHQAP